MRREERMGCEAMLTVCRSVIGTRSRRETRAWLQVWYSSGTWNDIRICSTGKNFQGMQVGEQACRCAGGQPSSNT